MRLENKIAIITGAGSGMGRAMAKRFASEGAHVVCADISGKQEAVAAEIGDAAVPIHTDVANEDDVRKMIAVAEDKFGRLDILVNNAGFGGQMAPLHEQTAESWDRVHSVNIRGVFFGMKYGITSMLKTGGGAIVNISSASGLVGWKHHSIYGAAKAGVKNFMTFLHNTYRNQGIRATTILPGETNTPIMDNRARPPLERERAVMLDPHDVARAVLLCASLQKGAMIPELQICPTFMRDTSVDIETARWVGAPDDTPDKPKK